MASRLPLRSNWFWLALCLVALGAISILTQRNNVQSPPLAAESARPDGGLALNLWLQHLGYRVSVLHSAPQPARGNTLFLLASGSDLTAVQAKQILSWASRGGRLVIGADGDTGNGLLDALHVHLFPPANFPLTVSQPLLLAPPVAKLSGTADLALQTPDQWVEVVRSATDTVLAQRRYGAGLIWAISAPSLLDNAHIARADNRRLLLNMAGPPRSTVLLDEFRPPAPAGATTDWLTQTVWGVAILFLAALAVLYRWLAGWRLGPALVPFTDRYRTATEYVVSLAALLYRAGRRTEILALYQQELARAIRRRYGDVADIPAAETVRREVADLLVERRSVSDEELVHRAGAIIAEEERVQNGRF